MQYPLIQHLCWKQTLQAVITTTKACFLCICPPSPSQLHHHAAGGAASHWLTGLVRADMLLSWQVIVDVPRTAPGVPFFAQRQLQKSLERILYLWGIR